MSLSETERGTGVSRPSMYLVLGVGARSLNNRGLK